MTTTPTDTSEEPFGFRRHSYESQCKGKRPYTRKQDVKRAVKSAERTSLRVGRMSAYRCPHCGTWRMGHSPAPKLPKSAYVGPVVDLVALPAPHGGQRCG